MITITSPLTPSYQIRLNELSKNKDLTILVHKIHILSLSLALSALPVSVSAASFSELIVMGDSLSDSGNIALVTAPAFQPVPFRTGDLIPDLAYENGRFTNGSTWVETLATSLGLDASPSLNGGTNWAFGGARTGPFGTVFPTPPSLLDQFGAFQLSTGGVAPSDALYVVWGGSINLIFDAAVQKQTGDDAGATATISQSVSDITTIVEGLTTAGAVNVLVPNSTNLGLTPLATSGAPGLDTVSTAVSLEFNALLSDALTEFSTNPALNLIAVDVFEFSNSIVAAPGSFGLTNVDDPCVTLTSVCINPDEFFFYDGIHPTATIHTQFAQLVRRQIETVPEPSGLLGMGLAVGLGRWLNKRNKGKLLEAKQVVRSIP